MNTVAELLQNHVSLCVESLDRIYLNGYIPKMQVGEQLHAFLVYRRGAQVASGVGRRGGAGGPCRRERRGRAL